MENIKIKTRSNNFGYNIHQNDKIKKFLSLELIKMLLIISLILLYIINKANLINNNKIKTNFDIKDKKNLSEKLKLLKILTNNDESEYKGVEKCLLNDPDKEFCIYHLIIPKEVIGKKRILLGDKTDGCYVLLDDFENIKIAYSFGIFTNIQFDKALADKGINVYMYDHTINNLPYQNPYFHWKKLGLCGNGKRYDNMKSLEELIIDNNHTKEKDMILKMDIEHWEWEAILNLKEETLNQFKYIAIEYHFKERNFYVDKHLYYNRAIKTNFGNNRICHIIEVSYIIKKGNTFKKDETILPIYDFDYLIPASGKSEMNLNILNLFVDE